LRIGKILNWRLWVAIAALAIVAASIFFIYKLSDQIAIEEAKRIQHYSLAIEHMARSLGTDGSDINLASTIASDNTTIPVILADSAGNIAQSMNVEVGAPDQLQAELKKYAAMHKPIIVDLDPRQYVYYGESNILKQLRYFPLVLFGIIALFFIVVWYAYASASRAIQNKVWVGMSKETAHQLGTPLMSLLGWVEYLKSTEQANVADEMQKDVDRLQLVADRFSKIGSVPQLQVEDVIARIQNVAAYMQVRSPKNVAISVEHSVETAPILINGPLFDWVIENLIRNALDALEGKGSIKIHIDNRPVEVVILVSDTGKGMTKAVAEKVFKPGYSTKARGWGLGLSLAKRIIRTYHHGSIEVASSAVGVGTTFRIVLRR
jgi:signal transduction histidine kinase